MPESVNAISNFSTKPLVVMPIFGTRPEAVKMAPLVNLLKSRPADFQCVVAVTAQHRQMLDQVLEAFHITPDHDLNIMTTGQTLADITTRALNGLDKILSEVKPDVVLAQGDTTTVLASALAASYHKIPFGHVEAGLRTNELYDPFPEEINRRLTSQITQLHFAPTPMARENLLREGIAPESIYVTGNTVIDALRQMTNLQRKPNESGERMILATTHRRENLGEPLEGMALAMRDIVEAFPDTRLVLPMHKNPVVRDVLTRVLGDHPRVELCEPADYLPFVRLMERAHLVLTDSGGVQEEAPSLGLPVLVMRRTTERPEGVTAGTAKLVGTKREDIVREASRLLADPQAYAVMSQAANPYGDGQSGERIAQALLYWAGRAERPLDFTPAA
jgi:UDP-N-acetylglucosamine 2-epimerase (non-hydrolysing)